MKNQQRNKGHETPEPKAKKSAFTKWLQLFLSGDFLAKQNFLQHVPFILYLCFFFLLSIYIGHVFESTERQKIKIERELNELSAEYKTLKSELEAQRQQSSVLQRIDALGLQEPTRPPIIIDNNPDKQ